MNDKLKRWLTVALCCMPAVGLVLVAGIVAGGTASLAAWGRSWLPLVAALACPIGMGLMVWWFLRQSGEAPEPSPTQQLALLQKRQAALDEEIVALEAQASETTRTETVQPIEMETPTA